MPITHTVPPPAIHPSTAAATPLTDDLIARLREELTGYGDILALFDEQQIHLMNRDAARVAQSAHAIEDLMQTAARLRASRETCVADLARAHKRPASTRLQDLLPLLHDDLRILTKTLINEINHLIHRVRRRARQNHLIIATACRLHHELLTLLCPDKLPGTYTSNGRVSPPALRELEIKN